LEFLRGAASGDTAIALSAGAIALRAFWLAYPFWRRVRHAAWRRRHCQRDDAKSSFAGTQIRQRRNM